MGDPIKFGTDGWRGVIAEDYTFDNVRRAAQGFASYLHGKGKQGAWIVVGHDKRFDSEYFAAAVAEVLAGNGFHVHLTDGPTPRRSSPTAVVANKAAGAVNITASHNPATDNGFKVRRRSWRRNRSGGACPHRSARSRISVDAVRRRGLAEADSAGDISQVRSGARLH